MQGLTKNTSTSDTKAKKTKLKSRGSNEPPPKRSKTIVSAPSNDDNQHPVPVKFESREITAVAVAGQSESAGQTDNQAVLWIQIILSQIRIRIQHESDPTLEISPQILKE